MEGASEAGGGPFAAKSLSKAFKVVSVAGIVACSALKWLGVMPEATVGEVCATWAVAYGIGAGTIDLNIALDKFLGGRR